MTSSIMGVNITTIMTLSLATLFIAINKMRYSASFSIMTELSVTHKPFMLSVIMLNVVMMSVITLNVVLLSVVVPHLLLNLLMGSVSQCVT
jgi:hypothetical protein